MDKLTIIYSEFHDKWQVMRVSGYAQQRLTSCDTLTQAIAWRADHGCDWAATWRDRK